MSSICLNEFKATSKCEPDRAHLPKTSLGTDKRSCQLLCLHAVPQPWGEISPKSISPLVTTHALSRRPSITRDIEKSEGVSALIQPLNIC